MTFSCYSYTRPLRSSVLDVRPKPIPFSSPYLFLITEVRKQTNRAFSRILWQLFRPIYLRPNRKRNQTFCQGNVTLTDAFASLANTSLGLSSIADCWRCASVVLMPKSDLSRALTKGFASPSYCPTISSWHSLLCLGACGLPWVLQTSRPTMGVVVCLVHRVCEVLSASTKFGCPRLLLAQLHDYLAKIITFGWQFMGVLGIVLFPTPLSAS